MKTSFKKTIAAGFVSAAILFSASCSRGDRTTGQTVDDSAVTTKVKAAFAKDPGVKAIDVNVRTFKGTVQLRA